jgi:serine/threonine-protein kinase ATR
MAAQLINDISSTNQPAPRPVQEDAGDLKALMEEVASAENNAALLQDAAALLEHKHQLIYVFSRAVFERLAKAADDPFLRIEQTVSQASDALDVFVTTIRELPEVLDYTLKPKTQLHLRGSEPFWVWLFPRVLALLGREKCEKLTEKINSFFQVAFQAVTRSPKLWNLSSLFFLYLKECVTSTFSLLTSYVCTYGIRSILVPLSNTSHWISQRVSRTCFALYKPKPKYILYP